MLAGVNAIGWVLIAVSIARGITHLATGQPAPYASKLLNLLFDAPAAPPGVVENLAASVHTQAFMWTIIFGFTGGLLRAVAAWGQEVLATRAALGEKEYLRGKLVEHRLEAGGAHADRAAEDAVLASHGLDGLDGYYTEFLPALVSAMVVPVILGFWILLHDWISAAVLVLTLPLIPLFMILIGKYTENRIHQAAEGLNKLSHQLFELARGLPVLVGLRRAGFQRKALKDVSEKYNATTLATLRTAFMSGLALELIATLSVAVIAVFIGIRLVGGSLELYAGLMVLTLAAEVYLPFRDIGAAYHSSEDGVEALRRAKNQINQPLPSAIHQVVGTSQQVRIADSIELHELTISYKSLTEQVKDRTQPVRYLTQAEFNLAKQVAKNAPDDDGPDIEYLEEILPPVVRDFSLTLIPNTLTVLTASSGTGKTTLLRSLAGNLRSGEARFEGEILGQDHPAAWLSQHPGFTETLVDQELSFTAQASSPVALESEVEQAFIQAALEASGLADRQTRVIEELSPGERRRLGMARVLVRMLADPQPAKPWLVLLDEPTAHLDPVSARKVRATLNGMARGMLPGGVRTRAMILVASHDQDVYELADQLVDETFQPHQQQTSEVAPALSQQTEEPNNSPAKDPTTDHLGWRSGLRFLPWKYPKFWAGILLSTATMLSAVFLAAMSGWLIVQASYQPPVLYLLAVIVAVRFFGISRAVFRYAERVIVHDAVLAWAQEIRLKIWDALGSAATQWNRLTRSGAVLSTLISDVDELRDAVPRVMVPLPTAVLTWAMTSGVVAYMAPAAWWPVVVAGLLVFVVLPPVLTKIDSATAGLLADHRSSVLQRTSGLLSAASDLVGNRVHGPALQRFLRADAQASIPLKKNAIVAGLRQAWIVAVVVWAAVHTMLLGVSNGIAAPNIALVVMMILALNESFGLFATAIHESSVIRHQLIKLTPLLVHQAEEPGEWVGLVEPVESSHNTVVTEGFELHDIDVRYGPAAPWVLKDFSLRNSRGDFQIITGSSGSGKSTLLAVLLGFLKPEHGSVTLRSNALNAAQALQRVAWCPQEAYLFDSSLRSNLLLAGDGKTPLTDEDLVEVLRTVGLGDWLENTPHGLDTRLGPSGHFISGGQRQRVAVARALLAQADIVLLDEPTAHLGADEAAVLVNDLRQALADRTVVMVTHDARWATESLVLTGAAH